MEIPLVPTGVSIKGKILALFKETPNCKIIVNTAGANYPLQGYSRSTLQRRQFSCAYPLTLSQVILLMKSVVLFLCPLIRLSELLCACLYANRSSFNPQPKFLQNLATSMCISLLLLFAPSDASFIILSFLPPSSHSCI